MVNLPCLFCQISLQAATNLVISSQRLFSISSAKFRAWLPFLFSDSSSISISPSPFFKVFPAPGSSFEHRSFLRALNVLPTESALELRSSVSEKVQEEESNTLEYKMAKLSFACNYREKVSANFLFKQEQEYLTLTSLEESLDKFDSNSSLSDALSIHFCFNSSISNR